MAEDAGKRLFDLQRQDEELRRQAQNFNVHESRLRGPATEINRKPPDEATALNPEAAIAGVLSSLVLGPVGGVLLGAATGFLQKRGQQNILDAAAADNETYNASLAIVQDRLSAMREGATRPQDYDQINSFADRIDFYTELGRNPRFIDESLAGLEKVLDETQQFETQQERDAIEDRNFRKSVGDDVYNRYQTVKQPFDAASYDYIEQMRVVGLARDALLSGNPSDISAAITAFAKLGDPTTGVQGGEREGLQNIGPLYDRLTGTLQSWKDGRPMTVDQRNDMLETIDRMGKTFQEAQERRQALAFDNLGAAGVFPTDYPEKYDAFRVTDKVFTPELKLLPPDPNEVGSGLMDTVKGAQASTSMFLGDWYDEIKQDWGTMTNAADTALFDAADAARAAGEPISEAMREDLNRLRVRYETAKGLVTAPYKRERPKND